VFACGGAATFVPVTWPIRKSKTVRAAATSAGVDMSAAATNANASFNDGLDLSNCLVLR